MKKYVVLLSLALAATAAAQQATSSAQKPSAAQPRPHRIMTQKPMAQPAATADATALPVGTAIRMKLETPISTQTNKRGDRFGGRVVEAVTLNGQTIIPVGSALEGTVLRADEHRRIRGTATLDLLPQIVTLPDGQRFTINASIVDTSNRPDVDVNDEGQIKGRGHDRGDLIETAAGAAVGASVGGAIRGGKGALIGATIGAGATVIHWLTKTKSADLPPGTELVLELSRPMQLNQANEGD